MTPLPDQDQLDPLDDIHEEPGEQPPRRPGSTGGTLRLITSMLAIVSLLCGGYFLLYTLLQERPQFVGSGLRQAEPWLLQDCPSFVLREVGDPSYAYTRHSPRGVDVVFDMETHEDRRGLRVIRSLDGKFRGSFSIENPSSRPAHVLLRCPRPSELRGGSIDVESFEMVLPPGAGGELRRTPQAELWVGQLGPSEQLEVQLSYQTPAVSSVSFALEPESPEGVDDLSVAVRFDKEVPLVLQGSRDETGKRIEASSKEWSRQNFMLDARYGVRLQEGYSVFEALKRLLQIAPLVTILFVATLAALLARGRRTRSMEVILLSVVYGYYFPLLVYLNARYAFHWAFLIAFCASAAILLNYARFLMGFKKGVLGGLVLLVLFQVVPTLMAFAAWDRGMCLLSLSAVTLFALVDLQTQKLKQRVSGASLAFCAALPLPGSMQDIRVSLPAELVASVSQEDPEAQVDREGELIRGIASYDARAGERMVEVQARIPIEATAARSSPVLLLPQGTYLRSAKLPEFLKLEADASGIWVWASEAGVGEIECVYGASVSTSGSHASCQVPLFSDSLGWVRFESTLSDVRFEGAGVWHKEAGQGTTLFELGVSGRKHFGAVWELAAEHDEPQAGGEVTGEAPSSLAGPGVYGIDISDSRHLTIVESDGALLHFALFTVAADSNMAELSMTIPAGAEIASVTVDGFEVESPAVDGSLCTVSLGESPGSRRERLVELRIRPAPLALSFMGRCNLELPRGVGTEARVEWAIAFPDDFRVELQAGGLKRAVSWKSRGKFGSYGAVLLDEKPLCLGAVLLPPREIRVSLAYSQRIPGMTD